MFAKDIILFAGQGSTVLAFDKSSILSTSTIASRFVKSCHEAFLSDLESIPTEARSAVEQTRKALTTPESLANPPPSLSADPIAQSVTLYVHQILDFISYTRSADPSQRAPLSPIETAGFCSGVLPAVIVALCPSPEADEFLETAVVGFRLAFWIGLRSALFCERVVDESSKHLPWSLTVRGLAAAEIERLLKEYNGSVSANVGQNRIGANQLGHRKTRHFHFEFPPS